MQAGPGMGPRPAWRQGPMTEDDSPGQARLHAVREQGRVVGFTWVFVSDAAARLLRSVHRYLLGRGLRVNVGAPLGNPVLVDRYRRVLDEGLVESFEQVHLVDGRLDIVVHRVVPVGDGVEVTLTNRSAALRAQAAAHETPITADGMPRLSSPSSTGG